MKTDAPVRLRALRAGPKPNPSLGAAIHNGVKEITQPRQLPDKWRDFCEERAAIREYDGGETREHAEAEALRETLNRIQAGENAG